MLRVHFTAQDLLGVRFASAPSPLLELSLALATRLRTSRPFGAGPVRPAPRRLPAAALPMLSLLSASGDGAMFLDPICADFAEGLDLVRASPAVLVTREVQRIVGRRGRLTAWHQDLAAGDRTAWQALTTAIISAYRAILEPDWLRVVSCLSLDVMLRGQMMSRQGLPGTLAGLYPGARWHGTMLAIPSVRDRDVHLNGAGLTATPSAYWVGRPLRSVHPDGSTVLIYPAAIPVAGTATDVSDDPLAELLGRTRAAALRALVDPNTTSGLSNVLGVSVAAASEHAKVLRNSGLIVSARLGKCVIHRCSPLGLSLLAQPFERSAAAAELPIVNLDVAVAAEPRQPVAE
ncbi:MAG TPA: winged helix-turn-helix domain-containing protein [Jatrophihabitans sp.]|nr:winged helix-turn-helix domain-containing protein [Jatrophihabitans sp.]